jgi:transcriptional regulator of acetoin/glycerol metabolism
VRELLNVLERLSILCDGDRRATVDRVQGALNEGEARPCSPRARFDQGERRRLEELLLEHRFNVSALARRLGVSRGALRYRLRKYGLA